MTTNQVAGTWLVESADLITANGRTPLYGPNPSGVLIFTEDLHFAVVLNDSDLPPFASGDRMTGTPEENRASVTRTLGLYGTYRVDERGAFASQIVTGSTFPDWAGLARDTTALTETVTGDLMLEHLSISPDVDVEIAWRRAPLASDQRP